METISVMMFKIPFRTKHFNVNQKVWVQKTTGDFAAKATGKFRGSGRYIEAWVNWDKADRTKYPFPEFKEIEVAKSFAIKHGLQEA